MSVMPEEAEVQVDLARASAAPGLPALGFRNYWYPVIGSRRVRRRPVPVTILGEDLVLFRSEGKVGALEDRCPHRGTRLSLGRVIFPGTLSCGYHGWTYNRQGECLAALVEGPDSKIPGKVRVLAYPVEERFGVVWVFMGEGEPPPLEEDLPPDLLKPNAMSLFLFEEWASDWRNMTENIVDASHPFLVHRNSLVSLFMKSPAGAARYSAEPLPDGKGVVSKSMDVVVQGDYPGLGKYPARSWWRVIGRGWPAGLEMRMPGYVLVRRQDPYFGFHLTDWQWPVPTQQNHSRIFLLTIAHPKTFIHRLALKALWWIYSRPLRLQFIHQDKRILEPVNYRDPEKLSAGDAGVIQFRRLAAKVARQPRGPGRTGAARAGEPANT